MAPLSTVFRGRSISATPPRAVYSDLSSAHASITGRTEAPLPPLPPGWAGDQPTTAGNEKSTPVSVKARTVSQGTPIESPLAVRRARSAKPVPSGTPDIRHPELGEKFQKVSPSEKGFDGHATKPDIPSNAADSHRRSRSTGFLGTFAWYEADYGSNQPNYPERERLSFGPQDSQLSPPSAGAPSQLPYFRFPSPGNDHSASGSTIAYDDSNSLPHVAVESWRDRRATGHRGGQLSQSAWSPRPSNDGLELIYQRRSTHGEILDVRDEHPDAANGNPQYAFQRHPVSMEPASDANLMPVQRNEDTKSRPTSYAEVIAYEAALRTHARNTNIPNSSYSNEELNRTDDGDWETVGDFSGQNTRSGPPTKAQTSSFADYSSSSTGQRPAGLPPGGPFLEHASHPRYMRTWNLLRDQGTGGPMMLPSHIVQGNSDLEHYLNSPLHGQIFEHHYQHPNPLSEGHTNPFTSSPVSAEQGSVSQYSGDNLNLAEEESHDDFLMMSPSANKTVKHAQGNSSLKDHSSTWVSTEEGHSVSKAENTGVHRSAPMHQTGYQGNVTGTPEGTGTRLVGSSVANASSPGAQFSSSPYLASIRNKIRAPEPSKQVRKSFSIDSSLSSLKSLSSEDSYWTSTRNLPDKQVTDSGEYALTALPSSAYLPPEARFHRNQLIANNLLPRDSTPRSKRRSRGFDILASSPSKLKEATATASANLSRHIQHFVPNMPSLSAVRKRSPHRRETQDEYVLSDVEMQSKGQSRGRKAGRDRNKNHKKSKVSDSEGSVDSDVGLTSSDPRQTTSGNLSHNEPSTPTSIEPVELEGVQVHPTLVSITHGHGSATGPASVAQTAAYQTMDGNTTDFYLRRLLTPPSIEEMLGAVRDNCRTPRIATANRPIARAESPHLHRVPRPSTEAILRRQKELGRLILVPCILLAPLSLMYGFGYFDGAMDYLTRGQLSEMRPIEKKIALGYGVASMAALIAVIVWFFTA
ncbi:MAG: hypothetical protein Q9195_001753 [Heterodermia aff. obscurata]